MKQLDVVVFGEAMTMFIADEYLPLDEVNHYTRAIAGAEVNVATGLTRLGLRVGWISRLGNDPFGSYILRAVQRLGLDTTRVLFEGPASNRLSAKEPGTRGRSRSHLLPQRICLQPYDPKRGG